MSLSVSKQFYQIQKANSHSPVLNSLPLLILLVLLTLLTLLTPLLSSFSSPHFPPLPILLTLLVLLTHLTLARVVSYATAEVGNLFPVSSLKLTNKMQTDC